MAGDRKPDAFFRITTGQEHVVIEIGGKQYDATPSAAREIARNLVRKAQEIDEGRRNVVASRRHLWIVR